MEFKRVVAVFLLITLCSTIFAGCAGSKSKGKQSPQAFNAESTTEYTSNTNDTITNSQNNTSNSANPTSDTDTVKQPNTLKPIFTGEKSRNTVNTEFKPVKYEAKVSPYKINNDLSNIVNMDQFGSFTAEQKALIAKNGFVVTSSNEEQLFYLYDNNEYMKIPSFVTTDSVLQVFHLFFDYSLRTVESANLMKALKQMTESMLRKSILLYNQIKNPQVKAIALKNAAYFAVAKKALGEELPSNFPEEAKKLAEAEFSYIKEAAGIKKSSLFPFDLDYSQFKPRGHYTRNEDFEKYFKAMMWYGLVPFPVFKAAADGKKELNVEQTAQALLITYCTFSNIDNSSDLDLWEKIYEPTAFYIGKTDDLNLYHYKDILINVYGKEPEIEQLLEKRYIELLSKEVEKLPEPQIQAKWVSVKIPSGLQFRFMGQRYVPDSDLLQQLVEPYIRPVPKGLDVMAVLGSDRAEELLMDRYKEGEKWSGYPEKFAEQKSKFSKVTGETWRSNMYYGWLWTLKGLIRQFGEGYPSFMTNNAWKDKSLSTALASWAEMRHDTILYAKGVGAQSGGGMEIPEVKGYVEPNIDVYERLLWLTGYARQNLSQKGILPNMLGDTMQRYENLLQFLINCSLKELNNEELTKDEYNKLLFYGGQIERISIQLAGGYKGWYELTSETDKNMALIADVHSVKDVCLEVGVGPAAHIFVAVPIRGKLYLTRGAIFSYYEFMSTKRLTDEEWQKMLKSNTGVSQPDWMDTFINGRKGEIPKPAKPFENPFG